MESTGLSLMTALSVFGASAGFAQTDNFDKDRPGAVPSGWECGITGRGNPRWAVEAAGIDRWTT